MIAGDQLVAYNSQGLTRPSGGANMRKKIRKKEGNEEIFDEI